MSQSLTIAILECDCLAPELQRDFGTYPQMMARLLNQVSGAVECQTWQAIDGDLPAYDSADGFIVMGSQYGVYDRLPWMLALEDWIRGCVRAHKALVGICFGHQIIAHALGGRVEKSDKGWGIGVSTTCNHLSQPWQTPVLDQVHLLVSHQDQVVTPPAASQVVLSNDFCQYSALLIGESTLTFQGHPEFIPEYSRVLMERRRARIGDACVDAALASLSLPLDSETVGHWIVQFMAENAN